MTPKGAIQEPDRQLPWYAGGLRFECQQCGRCCTGAPGYVWVDPRERAAIAERLGVPLSEFEREYCRRVLSRVSLRERSNGDCFLLSEGRCRVYEVRPRQCRTYPFWKEILSSPQTWESAAQECPGINTGRLHALEEITEFLVKK